MMNRRKFLKRAGYAGGALVGSQFLQQAILAASEGSTALGARDIYGGTPSLRFKATGFFRLEKAKRWWLVTPEGNAFLSLGMNHVHPGWINQPYNAAHWRKQFGAKTFGDEACRAGLRAFVSSNLKDFGFNTLGIHNSWDWLLPELRVPWIKGIPFVNTHHYKVSTEKDFPDVFSPDFEQHCNTLAKTKAAPLKEDTFLLGYAMTDCPILTELDAAARPTHVYGSKREALPTWPRVLRNLPGEAPGKRAYVAAMSDRYQGNIGAFNITYATTFAKWEDLAKRTDWRPHFDTRNGKELEDNGAFLEKVVDRYYSVMTTAVKRHDPNHLILGDKLNANTDTAETVAHITAKYTDLVYYQQFGRWQEQRNVLNRLSDASGKPLFNGDGGFNSPHENMPNPHGPHAMDQKHRADDAILFAKNAFARNDFVGWTLCGWVDTWKAMPGKQFKQHGGLMDAFGKPYHLYQDAIRSFSDRMYQVATA
jgi:hypothetical protein